MKCENCEQYNLSGDPWGSIECSLMIDGFGKSSLSEELEPYRHKCTVLVPLLGMVNHILAITESGYHTASTAPGYGTQPLHRHQTQKRL